MTSDSHLYPVILSGGSGTRLWPLSRAAFPKQLLPLHSEQSLFQETALRARALTPQAPIVICNEDHRFMIAQQMQDIGLEARNIVLEPEGRNTAPAAILASLMVAAEDKDGLVLLLPSDHVIADVEMFRNAAEQAAKAARAGKLVTFGIVPTDPNTGYGYIRKGGPLSGTPDAFVVERFVEKPDRETAEAYVTSGDYYWNSGMFLFAAKALLAEAERLQPAMVGAVRKAWEKGKRDLHFLRLDKEAFAKAPSISIDYAIMEKTEHAAIVPADIGWNDIGSWAALWDIGERDAQGNTLTGDVIVEDVTNSYVRSEKPLLALIGVDNLVVVASDDAVLIADKGRAQDVRAIVDRLKSDKRNEHLPHTQVFRPWGDYRGLDTGSRFQVKHISVKPGGILSLQMHHHRAEHWIVVEGTARVTCGEKVFLLNENESTFIPLGTKHRLENPGMIPLRLIEVQSGAYLGEDDIVRFEDNYGRS
jgi:mannose-1-phosphate guanylyltransferase/mannose-6-phosphate isomerase